MSAQFPRIKVWTSTEDVTAADLNAEFDNILNNLGVTGISGYSANVNQMRTVTDPGEVGTENPATTLAGEIERLRFILEEITGEDYWYESPATNLSELANAIDTLDPNRITSGRVKSTSQQPMYLVANGTARTVTLKGATTPFIYFINGTQYTISTDVSVTNLTAAPSTNNTCLVNQAQAADQNWTKYLGENNDNIPVDTMGASISTLVGKRAAFSVNNGSATEYFTAFIESSTSLKEVRRGYFFNQSDAPIPRIVITNNDTITLMKLTWVFANTAGGLAVTYNEPTYSYDQPASPAIGDYWYDYAAGKWKTYNSTVFIDADAVFVGVCIQDTSATVGARSQEFAINYLPDNTVTLIFHDDTTVRSKYTGSKINVWGTFFLNDQNYHVWAKATDLESGQTLAPETMYYFYITEQGRTIYSETRPYDRQEDLKGYYHPYESWRCVGMLKTIDFGGGVYNFADRGVYSFFNRTLTYNVTSAVFDDSVIDITRDIIFADAGADPSLNIVFPEAKYWLNRKITVVLMEASASVTINASGSDVFYGVTSHGYDSSGLYNTDVISKRYDSVTYMATGDDSIVVMHRQTTSFGENGPTHVVGSYTPTLTGFGTVSSAFGTYMLIGNLLYLEGTFVSGTPTAVEARFSLPPNLTTTSYVPGIASKYVGFAAKSAGASTTFFGMTVLIDATVQYVCFGMQSSTLNGLTKQNGNVIAAATNKVQFTATFPVTLV